MNKENWKPCVIGDMVYLPPRLMYVILAFLIAAFIAVVTALCMNVNRTMKYESAKAVHYMDVSEEISVLR